MNLDQVPPQKFLVEHADSILRFWVRSRSQSGVAYLVDIGGTKEFPHGECSCAHFQFVVGPAQRRGEVRRCQHIMLAREEFANWAIAQFKLQDHNKE